MLKKVGSVAKAIAQHAEVLNRVISVGMEHELAYFPVLRLEEPISFSRSRKRVFTHFQPAAYAIGDHYPNLISSSEHDAVVDIEPLLSIRLQEDAAATRGIVTRLHYRGFTLQDSEFSSGTPDISELLVPETYSLESGDHFDEDPRPYGGSLVRVGGEQDRGRLALLVCRALAATAIVLGEHTQEELVQLAEP